MMLLKHSAIEAGDIIFVVSHKNNIAYRFKRLVQAITTSGSRHGHREVLSSFVCSERTEAGVICYNHERKLHTSTKRYRRRLQSFDKATLMSILNDNLKTSNLDLSKVLIPAKPRDIDALLKQLNEFISDHPDVTPATAIMEFMSNQDKSAIIALLGHIYKITGVKDTLIHTNSTLLVFKFNDFEKRQQFLEKYREQIAITRSYYKRGKNRSSIWKLFYAMFLSGHQDRKDRRENREPSETTFCSRNIAEVLNQVDPDLVLRGRHSNPKSLEAGLREATELPDGEEGSSIDYSEEMTLEDICNAPLEDIPTPKFNLVIIPKKGEEFLSTLINKVEKEITRIEGKYWFNRKDEEKVRHIKRILSPYYHKNTRQDSNVVLQVQDGLELLSKLMPVLKRPKNRFFSWLFNPRSFKNIRDFARTQGIFDGDIRRAAANLEKKEQLKKNQTDVPSEASRLDSTETVVLAANETEIFVFSDWSINTWPAAKKQQAIAFLQQQAENKACRYYVVCDNQLVPYSLEQIMSEINPLSLDEIVNNRLAVEVRPVTDEKLTSMLGKQRVESDKVHHMDYYFCQQFGQTSNNIEKDLTDAAEIFAPKHTQLQIKETKLAILDINLQKATSHSEKERLEQMKEHVQNEPDHKVVRHFSGIDNYSKAKPKRKEAIFKSLTRYVKAPKPNYYREEVYYDLTVNDQKSSPFEYFELTKFPELVLNKVQTNIRASITDQLRKRRTANRKAHYYEGKETLRLNNQFQPLPSLFPNEILTDLSIKGIDRSHIELKYSPVNNLYYIRTLLNKEHEVEINFLLGVSCSTKTTLANGIELNWRQTPFQELFLKYFNFYQNEKKLSSVCKKNNVENGKDYLATVNELNIGSCRLRCIAFKQAMKEQFPDIPVRIVMNNSHAFVELQLEGRWKSYCLRGYSQHPQLDKIAANSLQCRRKHGLFCSTVTEEKADDNAPQQRESLRL